MGEKILSEKHNMKKKEKNTKTSSKTVQIKNKNKNKTNQKAKLTIFYSALYRKLFSNFRYLI